MTQDEIIRMAREAGILNSEVDNQVVEIEDLERFAALVADHERNKYLDKLAEAIDLSVKAEREACAKVCMKQQYDLKTRQTFAAAIRARGEK
jgi:phosphoglycerate-specific signal transduction histidine kinase